MITNAGRAHLEGFGSTENVARGKAEIITGLQPRGTFVYNADSPWAPLWRDLAAGRNSLSFGIEAAADVASPGSARLDWTDRGFRNRFVIRAGEDAVEVEASGRCLRVSRARIDHVVGLFHAAGLPLGATRGQTSVPSIGNTQSVSASRGWATIGKPTDPTDFGMPVPISIHSSPGRSSR